MNETRECTTTRLEKTILDVSEAIAQNCAHSGHLVGAARSILEGGIVLTAEERGNLAASLYEGGCEHPLELLPEARLTRPDGAEKLGNPRPEEESTVEVLERRLLSLGNDIAQNTAHGLHGLHDVGCLLKGGLVLTERERNELAEQLRLGGCEHAKTLLPKASFSYDEHGRFRGDTTA